MAEAIFNDRYILTSPQDVQHDGSMSGNGTLTSPLGVVPGYNETVLWENNGSFSAKGLTAGFSEPASAFERLMFVCGTDIHSKNCSVVEYHPGSASINWPEFYSNGFRYWQTTFNINDTGMTAGPGFFCQWTYSTATNAWSKGNTDWQYNYQGIKKVIGINRKQ